MKNALVVALGIALLAETVTPLQVGLLSWRPAELGLRCAAHAGNLESGCPRGQR